MFDAASPLFTPAPGLPNVIEYYLTCADGLPCSLKQYCRRSQVNSAAQEADAEPLYEAAKITPTVASLKPVRPHGQNRGAAGGGGALQRKDSS